MSFLAIKNQDRVKRILKGAIKNKRIANAYLFVGNNSQVLKDMALAFVLAVNCEEEKADGCGDCLTCKKIKKGIHPDLIFIEKVKKNIVIDQIRDLKEFTRYGPSEGKWKVVIIESADSMTIEAANSFLKLLEEPPEKVFFILLSERENNLPKTITSRCQKIIFGDEDYFFGFDDNFEKFFERLNYTKNIVDLLALSDEISKNREEIETMLNQLLLKYRQRIDLENKDFLRWVESIKIVFDAYRDVNRNANLRLTLDNMFLMLKETKNEISD